MLVRTTAGTTLAIGGGLPVKLAIEHIEIMSQPRRGDIEHSAEMPIGVIVDQSRGNFFYPQAHRRGARPKLHRKRIARFIELQRHHRADAMRFESAKRIGDVEVE